MYLYATIVCLQQIPPDLLRNAGKGEKNKKKKIGPFGPFIVP